MNDQMKPKRTMAEAENKSKKLFRIGLVVAYFFIILVLMVFNTYLHQAFTRASGAWNFFGILLILASFAAWWKLIGGEPSEGGSSWGYPLAALVLLVLGLCMACGFNFDLHGMKNIPG